MSTYATEQDIANYIEGWVTDDVFALERLIQRCERDIDLLVAPLDYSLPPTQVVSLPGAASGSFTLDFLAEVTSALTYNADGSVVQAALKALSSVGSGGVDGVIGSNPWTVVWNSSWAETNFSSAVDFAVPLLTVDGSGLGPGGTTGIVTEVPGRKISIFDGRINRNQILALSRATCAQVEYRLKMGESFFVRAQYDSVQGPDFTTTGRLPRIGPKVREELGQSGLLWSGGRAIAGRSRRGVGRGWASY